MCFEQLAGEERIHLDWWSELLVAWESGLVPDIANEDGLRTHLQAIHSELDKLKLADYTCLSGDDALDLAARLEFHMLDPLFGELLDLLRPGGHGSAVDSYSRHVRRLMALIEKRYTRPGMASFLAGVLGRTLENQHRLSALALRDQLTGLYNRRGILSHLDQWLSWSVRYGRPLGVILLDVDHLKAINDAYGHEAGDLVLENVALALREAARAADTIGRLGGDDFVVLAPETEGAELDALMARLIESVSAKTVHTPIATVPVSVSAGGAWVPGSLFVPPEELLAQADRSMYQAKGLGRNCSGAVLSVAS